MTSQTDSPTVDDAQAKSGAPAAGRSDRFPAGIPAIVGNEGAERFSYYGMRAILYVYLGTLYAHFVAQEVATARATAVAHLFMAAVYAFPMIGAILADRVLGKYPVIFWVSLVYCAGHGVLALAGRFDAWGEYKIAEYAMYTGLTLIAIGSGGIKPCVSANVGDQFTADSAHLVTKVFQIFYFMINFGSFFSTLLTPLLFRRFGPEVAFGVPGIFMAIATLVFWLGRNRFTRIAPRPGGRLGGLDLAAGVLLFSPIVAVIVAVFVVGGHYEAPSAEGIGATAFYWRYVTSYVSYLGAHSWVYFAVAAVLFAAGIAVAIYRQQIEQDTGFFAMVLYALKNRHKRRPGMGFFDTARQEFGDDAADGPPAVLRIVLVFSMVSVFWALFDQHASTWIGQAQQMERELTLPLWLSRYVKAAAVVLAVYGGTWLLLWVSNRKPRRVITVGVLTAVGAAGIAAAITDAVQGQWVTQRFEAAQIQALNPLMVMLIIPLLNVAVYKPLEKRRGTTVRPLVKMTAGMFLTAVAFGIAAVLQSRIETLAVSGAKVHVLWQVAQYLIMTTAEVLVSVTGLEFAYTQAPRRMKSTIMGFWLLSVTAGNILVAFLAPMQTILSLSEFFWVFTGLMSVAAVVFAILATLYKGRTYLQTG